MYININENNSNTFSRNVTYGEGFKKVDFLGDMSPRLLPPPAALLGDKKWNKLFSHWFL